MAYVFLIMGGDLDSQEPTEAFATEGAALVRVDELRELVAQKPDEVNVGRADPNFDELCRAYGEWERKFPVGCAHYEYWQVKAMELKR